MGHVRTVRLLDRLPGGPAPESRHRTVEGVAVELGVPFAQRRGGYPRGARVRLLLALEIGESFVASHECNQARASKTVKASGRRYASSKQPDGSFRIWRVE